MTTTIANPMSASTIRLLWTLMIITDKTRLPVPKSSSVSRNCKVEK